MIRLIILISFIEAKENVPFVAGHFLLRFFTSTNHRLSLSQSFCD